MLATIHIISDNIIFRKSYNWKNTSLNDNCDFECEKLYNTGENYFINCLENLSKKQITKQIEKCINNLYSIKAKLDFHPWHIPTTLNNNEFNCFLKDLDFYLMLSGLLIKASELFTGYMNKVKGISYFNMLPCFSSNSKKVQQTLNILPASKWQQNISLQNLQNVYLNNLHQFEVNFSGFDKYSISFKICNQLFQQLGNKHNSMLDEEIYAKRLVKLNQMMQSDQFVIESWKNIRQIIMEGIIIGSTPDYYTDLYYDLIKIKMQQSNIENLDEEIDFLKYQQKQIAQLIKNKVNISPRCIMNIKILIKKVMRLKKEDKELQSLNCYLEWTHNPKDFVKSIHTAISNGYLKLKGNTDMEPIIHFLTNFIKVRKQNNSGSLSTSSLLSYFKKANVGDL